MRRILGGLAVFLLSFLANQIANLLDLSYGLYAGSLAAVIGYGLIVTSAPARVLWKQREWRNRIMVVLLTGLVTGLLGSGTAALLIWQEERTSKKAVEQPKAIEKKAEPPSVEPPPLSKKMEIRESPGSINIQADRTSDIKINVTRTAKYIPPSSTIKKELTERLRKVRDSVPEGVRIQVETESGNTSRQHVAELLGGVLEEVTLGSYPRGNTYTGRFPDHPISIHCSETNIPLAKSVELALGEYIKEGLNVVPVKGLGPRFIRVYLNGQPHFEEDGSVVFD